MTEKFKSPTNQQLVALWLSKLERNYSYIARHTGIHNSTLTDFKQGKSVGVEVIVKLAEFTGLPLRMLFKGCKTELVFNKKR